MSYQQYQQPQFTSTSTQGVYWNGSAWVSSASSTVCVSSVSSTSSATPSGGTNSIFVSELNAAPYPVNTGYRGQTQTQTQKSLVELYTEYYHGWQACLKDYERLQQHSADRQQRIDWARYYADESSRAAHYYYEQSTRGIINPPPPPFDLPPAPPPSTTTTTTMSSSSSSTTSQTHIASTKYPISLSHSVSSTTTQDSHTPGSLTHYVQRCLQPCNTVEQRTQVQAQVEKVIAQAIRDGNLHTKNWNLEPLLSIPSDSHYQSYSDSYNDSCSYYGPVSIPSSDTHPFSSCTPSSLSTHLPQSRENVSTPNKTQKRFSLTKLPQKKRQKHNSTNTNSSVDDNGLDSSTKALQKRQERFSGPGGLMESTGISTTTEIDYGKYMGIRIIGQGQPLNDQDYERMTVKGTCTTLEKEYLRLTAPPRAELVRPEHILKQHLQSLKQDYYNDKNHDYLWFCSQLKVS